MNVLQLVQMLKSGNPQQLISGILQNQLKGNPIALNVISMLQNNDQQGIEQLARNLAKEKGFDADEIYNQVKSTLGMWN